MTTYNDGWGDYTVLADNADISYTDIAMDRERNRAALDAAKRHPGVTRTPIDYNMCLTRFFL